MKANRLLIGALAVVLGICTVGLILRLVGVIGPYAPVAGKKELADYQPKKIEALGRIEPVGGIIQIGVPTGDRIRSIDVKEGDKVDKDQTLAVLESYDARLAEKKLAESQLDEALARRIAVKASGESQIEEAKLKLQLIREVEPLDLKAQEDRISLLRAQLDRASVNLKRLETFKPGTIPEQDLENQRLLVRQATFELASAEAQLQKMKKSHSLNLQSALAQLESAHRTLARTLKEIPVDSLAKSLRLAEERLKSATVLAPTAGRILKINAHPGELVGSTPILRMADTRQMLVVAEVYETEVRFLRTGLRAVARSPALDRQQLDGVVDYVGSSVARNYIYDIDPRADVDRRVVEVKIRLDKPEPAANYINLQVQVVIPLED